MSPPVLMRLLGVAGLVPFVATALGTMFLSDLLLAVSVRGFLVYSAAILCFLAGTLWGETLPEPSPGDRAPILISNGVVLFVVFATMTAQPLVAGILLMLGHGTQMWYEQRLSARGAWYTRLRTWLTIIAVICHVLFVVALMWRPEF
ncbi:MAG: DUF3429 domain-containing protein [Pseudomonadota bacterium]